MELKVLILRGIPGSGKSTWARKFIKGKNDWVIVNRDSIRTSLGEYWVPTRENLVTNIEHSMIFESLMLTYNVIIDATNINPNTITKLKNVINSVQTDFNYLELGITIKIEFRDFPVPLNKAIWRDFWRGLFGGRSVGKKVIKRFYKQYQEYVSKD